MKKIILFLILLNSFIFGQVNRGGVVYTSAGNEAVGNLTSSYGYLMTSFRTSDMGLYLFASKDGKSWTKLTAGNSYNGSSSKSTVVRDPSVIYTRDKYWVVHTSNPFAIDSGFSVISSEDLITWDTVAFVDVSSVCTPYSKVYAPDFYLDPVTDSVFVYVTISDSLDTDFKIYELNPTNDAMTTWSSPTLVNGNFPPSTIDANMNRIGDTFYLFYTKNHTDSRIEYATSSTRNGVYVVQDSLSQLGWSEGSCLVDLGNGSYRLYYDNFPTGDHKIYYTESSDTFATWSTPQIIETPYEDIQHGTIVKTNNTKIITDAIFPNYKKEKNVLTFPYNKTTTDFEGNACFRFMVSSDGSSTNDGLTWSNAFRELDDVKNVLPSDLNGYRVWIFIDGGTYKPFNYTFNNSPGVFIIWVGDSVNAGGSSFREFVLNGEVNPINQGVVDIHMGVNDAGSSLSGDAKYRIDAVDFTFSENTEGFAYWDVIRFTCDDATTQTWGTMLGLSCSRFEIWGSITIEFPNNTGVKNGISFNDNVSGFIRGLKAIGKANTQAATYIGVLNSVVTNLSMQIRQTGSPGYAVGFKPDTVNGGAAYYDYTDIKYFFTAHSNYPSIGTLIEVNKVKFTDVVKSYGKPTIYLGGSFQGTVIYNSDYLVLSDNSTKPRTITNTKTSTTTDYVSSKIYELSNDVAITSGLTIETNGEIARGTTDTDIVYLKLASPNGTEYYIYPADGGGSLTITSTKP